MRHLVFKDSFYKSSKPSKSSKSKSKEVDGSANFRLVLGVFTVLFVLISIIFLMLGKTGSFIALSIFYFIIIALIASAMPSDEGGTGYC